MPMGDMKRPFAQIREYLFNLSAKSQSLSLLIAKFIWIAKFIEYQIVLSIKSSLLIAKFNNR